MKKTLTIAIMVTLMISILAACGGTNNNGKKNEDGSEPAAEKVKLSLWHNFTGDDLRAQTMRSIIQQFQTDHPNITLDIQAIPPDGYKTRLKTVAAADEMPDVFILSNGSMTQEFSAGKLIQPVNELIDSHKEWKEGFMPNSFDAFTVDGNIYSAPMGLSPTSILYYNKTILEENGLTVPKTWDELLNAINVLKGKNITPIALGNKAAWLAQSSIFSSLADRVTGTEWFLKAASQDGAAFTDPEFVQALTYMQQLGTAGAFQDGFNAIDNTQMEQMFAQGKAAMMIDGGWALSNLASNASEDALKAMGATVLPSIPGGKGDPNSLSGVVGVGMGLGKDAIGPKKDAAFELIYAMSGPEAQKRTLESNQLVSYKVELDKSKVSPIFSEVYELVNSVKMTPVYDGKLTSAGAEAVNNGLQELLMGGKPEDIAKKIQEAQAKALGK
ncbi:ABC transporter substrate-binding protein [Paenibacillus sp. FSL A5-0031]|uniref:extracellular solute-binding protein n=1 Tax=Paenibacillus sp. FSL A5-0031 TaxID=1920420 RepID=UPI00096EED6B|nr:extracellular solute-binding protein [Paenibacillus sp. FSL A5-0031]OME79088.1 ABC transporter substrate-binding protein [Paenibacillus sp. FSL A5-0031]